MNEGADGVTYSFDVCSRCEGVCCQDANPPLSETRKKIISEYLKKQKINIKEPFTKAGYSYPAIDQASFCVFLDKKTGKCIVHPVKPETCVAGPVTFDINFSTGKVEWFLKKNEICAYAGKLYPNKEAFKRHFDVAREQLSKLISELSPEEVEIILKIPEPETFKIGEDNLPDEVLRKLRKK